MNILIAPDSFKGTLSAAEVSQITAEAIQAQHPHHAIKTLPLADGGEGSIDVLAESKTLEKRSLTVKDPLFRPVDSYYYYDAVEKTAYIEMAKASGITLVKHHELAATETTTFGTGELIRDALKKGAGRIILFIGGSATNDAGIGMAEALGMIFRNRNSQKLLPIGRNLKYICEIDDYRMMPEAKHAEFIVATDVNNPFYGPSGAAYVYGPQKGAGEPELRRLDEGLRHISSIVKKQYGINLQDLAGSGAAGGLGGGCAAFLNARIESGADVIFKQLDFEPQVQWANLIISGEGKIDTQSLYDKLLAKVAAVARRYETPLWAVCGYLEGREQDLQPLGLQQIFALARAKTDIEEAINHSHGLLKKQANALAGLL